MSAAEVIPPELAVDAEPFTDDELATYFAVMDAGPNAELVNGPDNVDPEHAAAIEDAGHLHAWRIEADDQAEWAMRKLLVAQDELRELVEQRDEYVARIDRWLDRCGKAADRRTAYMVERLEDYGVRRREAGGAATLQLPSGVVKTTTSQPAADVDDDAAVADWLELRLLTPPSNADAEGIARFRLWKDRYDELVAAAAEPVRLVKRDPKVYVGPFRKLVHLAEQPVGTLITTTLRCGHTIVVATNELDATEGDHEVGEVVACSACPADPIDGPMSQPVASVECEPWTELVVVGPDDEPVPGAVVKPGGITPKVVPGV